MDEKQFGAQVAFLRKEAGLTQDGLADKLHVSPQAVSKWENGHSLPETALLPALSRELGVGIDELFNPGNLTVLEAYFGDGIEAVNVTKRLNRLLENDALSLDATAALLSAGAAERRVRYLTVKYKTLAGICYAVCLEGEPICLTSHDEATRLPDEGLLIIAGRYGTRHKSYDVMQKIEHYRPFQWNAYRANHEVFPSDPANDETEYLTLVYLNRDGIKTATCAEGESLAYNNDRSELTRQQMGGECFIPNVPKLLPFGGGMECSWAAALAAALAVMRVKTDYTEVMGVSGACYRLAFHSPSWDYSSVDGLVAYDYAAPGYAAYGYTPEMHGHIEKKDRPEHRAKIMKEIRAQMPVLGINLRVAPEWGVICGYAKDGEDLFCRTKYDDDIPGNASDIIGEGKNARFTGSNPFGYPYVDNWPFLLCYFDKKQSPPSPKENLLASLKVFEDCAGKTKEGGYFMGFKAYEVWAADLRNDNFYQNCDGEQMARRFSVNQFCVLSLYDARRAAYEYLNNSRALIGGDGEAGLEEIIECFREIADMAEGIHRMLDSGTELDGDEARIFWTAEKRCAQAGALDEMSKIERKAYEAVLGFLRKP